MSASVGGAAGARTGESARAARRSARVAEGVRGTGGFQPRNAQSWMTGARASRRASGERARGLGINRATREKRGMPPPPPVTSSRSQSHHRRRRHAPRPRAPARPSQHPRYDGDTRRAALPHALGPLRPRRAPPRRQVARQARVARARPLDARVCARHRRGRVELPDAPPPVLARARLPLRGHRPRPRPHGRALPLAALLCGCRVRERPLRRPFLVRPRRRGGRPRLARA